MAADWREMKLAEVITLKRGYDLPAQLRQPGDIPIVTSSGISGYHSEAKIKGPGVVTGRYGTIGKVYFCPQDFWPHNTTLYVQEFKGNDPRFIFYFLQTLDYRKYSDKAAVPGVNRNHLHTAIVKIPDINTQKRIADVLKSFDDKIEVNRAMNDTLVEIAQALFNSWFIDFDPVKAKVAGRQVESTDPQMASLFPSEFDESDLGLKPKGWAVCKIGDLAKLVGGATPDTKQAKYWEHGVYDWATPKDLSTLVSPVLLRTERAISDDGLKRISSGLLPAGSVLMSSRAPIGYLAISEIPVAINQGFIGMLPKDDISNLFILFWARANQQLIVGRANGSTFLEISKSNFRPIQLICPTSSVMKAFDELVRPMYERIANNERETKRLIDIRDSLLPKLISGDIQIPTYY